MADGSISRRTVLGVGGAGLLGAGLLGVAGCSSSGGGNQSGGGSTTQSGPVELAKLSEVPVGGSAASSTKFDGHPVVLSQRTAGSVAAFSAICTHMGCTVNPSGAQFQCPCHGSTYDAFTGQVLRGPAPAALTAITVKVTGDSVVTT